MAFRVAVLGDSAMWGQGLAESDRFAHLATAEIARIRREELEVVPGPGSAPPRGGSRSGAKLKAATKSGRTQVMLPSGGTVSTTSGDRAGFAMTFRSLFRSDDEVRAFLAGRNETPAARLFGENPATFPTVTDRVRDISARAGGPVHLVLMDGGVNDAEFEEVLDPEGPDIRKIDQTIERVFGHDLTDVVRLVRKAFPEALILVTGYYSVLSQRSDRGQLKALFEYLSNKPEWEIALNAGVQAIPVLRDLLNSLGFTKDVDALIEKAIRRSITAAAHAQHWSRHAIGALPAEVVGPGVAYVHPAFRPENALFAGVRSLVHSGYLPPELPPDHDHRGEPHEVRDHRTTAHAVDDEMLQPRLAGIPRLHLLGTYRTLRREVASAANAVVTSPTSAAKLEGEVAQRIQPLLREPDLPGQIVVSAAKLGTRAPHSRALRELSDALGGEIGRIETAMIASFIHPNPAGARQYADRIVTTHQRHVHFSLGAALRGMPSTERRGVALSSLRRHGIDPSKGVRQIRPIAFIDSVAVQLTGLTGVPPLVGLRARMTLGPRLSFDVAIPPGLQTLLRAFDTDADVRLADLTEVSIARAGRFDELVLYLNGQEFFRGRRDQAETSGDTVTFRLGTPVRDHRHHRAQVRDHRSR